MDIKLYNTDATKILSKCTMDNHASYYLAGIVFCSNGTAMATNGKVFSLCINHHKTWDTADFPHDRISIPLKASWIKRKNDLFVDPINSNAILNKSATHYSINPKFPDIACIIPKGEEFSPFVCTSGDLIEIQQFAFNLHPGVVVWLTTNSKKAPYVLSHWIPGLTVLGMPTAVRDTEELTNQSSGILAYKDLIKSIKEKT